MYVYIYVCEQTDTNTHTHSFIHLQNSNYKKLHALQYKTHFLFDQQTNDIILQCVFVCSICIEKLCSSVRAFLNLRVK